MKNRRQILVAFMLCAVMLLGIGYAALSDVLDITGTAELTAGNAGNAFDGDVYFESGEALDYQSTSKPDTVELSADKDNALFFANNLAAKGDQAQFKFIIKNDSALEVTVTPSLTVVGDETALETADKWFNVHSNLRGQATTIAAGGSFEYIITVDLKDTPTLTATDAIISSKFSITLNVVSSDTVTTGNN